MTTYRFVHLSDIHFGQERNGTIFIHEDVRQELLRDSRLQAAALGSATGILVTGDTAFSGKETEYERASEWLELLTDAVGCPKIAVCVIPGNHDVDLDRIEHAGEIVHNHLRNTPLTTLDAELEKIATGREESNPLLPKLATYRKFAQQYGCDFLSTLKPIWQKDYLLDDTRILRFVGFNSVRVSDKRDRLDQMVLGNTQYMLSRLDSIEYVVLIHHPIIWFRDRISAEPYLQRARVLLVGHEHHFEVRKVGENDLERLEIYAGAMNPPVGDSYPFRYNWLEFSLGSATDGQNLTVTVYPRVWEPSRTSFVPDLNRLNGEASKAFSLACPNFTMPPRGFNVESTTEASYSEESENGGTSFMRYNEPEPFARLRYFFWRYLSWQERIKVLVELNILPTTHDQPLPQTMERLGLDMAKEQGKLADLWVAVMEVVPPDKREDNPFTTERR